MVYHSSFEKDPDFREEWKLTKIFFWRWRADINGEELELYINQPVLCRTLVPVDLAWWKHPFSARAIFTLFRLWVISLRYLLCLLRPNECQSRSTGGSGVFEVVVSKWQTIRKSRPP